MKTLDKNSLEYQIGKRCADSFAESIDELSIFGGWDSRSFRAIDPVSYRCEALKYFQKYEKQGLLTSFEIQYALEYIDYLEYLRITTGYAV